MKMVFLYWRLVQRHRGIREARGGNGRNRGEESFQRRIENKRTQRPAVLRNFRSQRS